MCFVGVRANLDKRVPPSRQQCVCVCVCAFVCVCACARVRHESSPVRLRATLSMLAVLV